MKVVVNPPKSQNLEPVIEVDLNKLENLRAVKSVNKAGAEYMLRDCIIALNKIEGVTVEKLVITGITLESEESLTDNYMLAVFGPAR